jgi:GntR family transcriptional regulator
MRPAVSGPPRGGRAARPSRPPAEPPDDARVADAAVGLPRSSGVALHRQLYLLLRDRIVRGAWRPGDALPTEEALCARFGVSRITVRRALSDLQAQGLVHRRHGLGTFVTERAPAPLPAPTLSFVDGLRRYAESTEVRVISVAHAVPPPEVAGPMQLAAGERALHAVRCRSLDGVPVMATDAWVPERLGRRITAAALARRPLYEILMAQGVRFGRVVQEIGAKTAEARDATLLGTEVGAPLLTLVRLIHDHEGRPVQHLNAAIPSERGRVLSEITGAQINTLAAGFVVHSRGLGPAPGSRG